MFWGYVVDLVGLDCCDSPVEDGEDRAGLVRRFGDWRRMHGYDLVRVRYVARNGDTARLEVYRLMT